MLRGPLVLSSIFLLATMVLALLNETMRDKITQEKKQSEGRALAALLVRGLPEDFLYEETPDKQNRKLQDFPSQDFLRIGEKRPEKDLSIQESYILKSETGVGVGLYILRLQARGFGGPMELLAAYRVDGTLYHAVMLDNMETPGFGKRAEEPGYMAMFWDGAAKAAPALAGQKRSIPTTKRELSAAHLDAVSGSTISFRAISAALAQGSQWLVENITKK